MARDVVTIRLEKTFRTRLQHAARRRRVTPSAAARLAIEDWLRSEEEAAAARPYDQVVDLVGSVRGGEVGRSKRGGGWIARQLRTRASGGR